MTSQDDICIQNLVTYTYLLVNNACTYVGDKVITKS